MIQSNFQSNTLTPQFRHLWTLCIIRYTQIQSEIPIPRLTIISKSKNETTRGNWTNPISNQIFLNICMTLDIGQSNSKYQYFGLPSYQYLAESQKPRQRVSNADRKVFANPESFCDKFIIGWRISGYFAIQNIQIICKVSRWTGKFPDNLKSVRII